MFNRNLVFFLALIMFVPLAHAGKAPVFATDDSAIRGYDVVAYFTAGKPTMGSDKHK